MRPILLSLLLILPSLLPAQGFSGPEQDFSTPEAAITCFVDGFRNQDLQKAFSACAISQSGAHYDFGAMSRRLNAIAFPTTLAPSEYPVFAELNQIEILSRLARQVRFLYLGLLAPDTDFFQTKIEPTDAEITSFIASVDPFAVKALSLVRVDAYPLVLSERYHKLAVASARCFGAEDGTERVSLIKLGEASFVLGFHFLRYGNAWRIDSLSSPLANLPTLGVEKISLDDYLAALK